MVFFVCDACCESLKKNQVEKHSYRCRSVSYSCIDCQIRFTPQTYSQHVKCITENQKYGGRNYVEKEAKGELKQNAWCDQVQRAISNVKEPNLKGLLTKIQDYGNIPRKEAKFLNFLTNSCRVRDNALCKRAWQAIAEEAEKLKQEAEAEAAAAKALEEEEKSKTQRDSKEENDEIGELEDCSNEQTSFKWKKTIKRKLKDAGGEMKMKKLRKAVVAEYFEVVGESPADSVNALFEEKLGKSGVVVGEKTVSLAT